MAVRVNNNAANYIDSASDLPASFTNNTFTLMAWVYFVALPTNNNYASLFGYDRNETLYYDWLYVKTVSNNPRLLVETDDGTYAEVNGTTTVLAINTWYHLALVRSTNTSLQGYINGAVEATNTLIQTASAAPTAWRVGGMPIWGDTCSARFAGFKRYSRALSTAEIQQEMHTIRPQSFTNLRAFYPMFSGSGERTRDYSGNGFDFTEHGTLTDEDPPPVTWGSRGGRRVFVTGGTTFNQTVDVTTTTTFALIKSAGKIVAVTSTPAITRVAAVNKIVPAITTTATPVILKQGNKTVDTTATGSVTIARAITFVQTIAAAVTGTASLVKSVGKSVVTTATSVVTDIRDVAKTVAATSTGTVTQTKQATKSTNIVATGTATIAKETNKSIAIAVSAAITLVKTVSKLVSTTINAAVDIATQFIAGGGTLFTQTISTTATASVTVARQVQKTIAATVNATISVIRAVAKYISIPVAVTLTQARHTTKTIATTVTTTVNIYIGYFASISVTVTNAVTISSEIVAEILGTMYRNTASIAMRIKDTASSALTTIQTKILNIKGSDDGDI